MSAPVKKGSLTTKVDEVVNGVTVTTSGGFSTSITQAKMAYVQYSVPDGAAPNFDELTDLVEHSTLDADAKKIVKIQLERLKTELGKENDGDVATVQDSLRSVSLKMPALRPKLKLWIEKSPQASQPIQIVARNMLD